MSVRTVSCVCVCVKAVAGVLDEPIRSFFDCVWVELYLGTGQFQRPWERHFSNWPHLKKKMQLPIHSPLFLPANILVPYKNISRNKIVDHVVQHLGSSLIWWLVRLLLLQCPTLTYLFDWNRVVRTASRVFVFDNGHLIDGLLPLSTDAGAPCLLAFCYLFICQIENKSFALNCPIRVRTDGKYHVANQ